MAVPLLTKKVVKKRSAKFIRPQSDRRITVKVTISLLLVYTFSLVFVERYGRYFLEIDSFV